MKKLNRTALYALPVLALYPLCSATAYAGQWSEFTDPQAAVYGPATAGGVIATTWQRDYPASLSQPVVNAPDVTTTALSTSYKSYEWIPAYSGDAPGANWSTKISGPLGWGENISIRPTTDGPSFASTSLKCEELYNSDPDLGQPGLFDHTITWFYRTGQLVTEQNNAPANLNVYGVHGAQATILPDSSTVWELTPTFNVQLTNKANISAQVSALSSSSPNYPGVCLRFNAEAVSYDATFFPNSIQILGPK